MQIFRSSRELLTTLHANVNRLPSMDLNVSVVLVRFFLPIVIKTTDMMIVMVLRTVKILDMPHMSNAMESGATEKTAPMLPIIIDKPE